MEYIDKCTFVHLKISAWSGQKALSSQDFHIGKDGEMPSAEATRLGVKYVINPEELKVFQRLRRKAERLCLEIGTKFLGAFAVLNDGLQNLEAQLEEVRQEYADEVLKLLQNYTQKTETWIGRHFAPGQVQPVPVEDVERAFRFNVITYQVAGDALPASSDFADSLLSDVATEVRHLWSNSISGKAQISQRFINQPFEALHSKLRMLAFGDGRIKKVLAAMDELKQKLPTSGGLRTGSPEHLLLSNILLALMSPERLEDILNQKEHSPWSLSSGQPTPQAAPADAENNTPAPATEPSLEPVATEKTSAACGWF